MKSKILLIESIFLMSIVLWRWTTAALFSVYHIDQQNLNDNDTSHSVDCLYYYVLDHIIYTNPRDSLWDRHQIIPYCIPNQNQSITSIPTFSQGRPYTFDQLHQRNVTSEQLYSWSTSIDLVEDYEIYLKNETTMKDSLEKTFYNCSTGWFGRMCQYTFTKRLSLRYPTFVDVVTQIFDIKVKESTIRFGESANDHTLYSCYTHIECERDLSEICLDWREICDGKVDCVNDGQDEMFCAELEMNDCSKNEYRCHNGAQCIPTEMFNDDKFNLDCLDSTDELEISFNSICVGDPSFRCEERSCPNSLLFSCGDGECIETPFLYINELIDGSSHCHNRRHRFVKEIVLSRKYNSIINYDCWKIMFCYFRYESNIFREADCRGHPCATGILTKDCIKTIINNCQSTPQFVFPQSSVAFLSEIDLIYDINALSNQINDNLGPNYVCFRNQRCAEFLTKVTQVANKSTCQRIRNTYDTDGDLYIRGGHMYYYSLIDLVRTCIPIDRTTFNKRHCRADNLVHCQANQHCISKHRLMDGFGDCYSDFDEKDLLDKTSCSFNDNYRFKCLAKINGEIETICLSPILIGDYMEEHCLNVNDVLDRINAVQIKTPLFSYLCDEFLDMDRIDNESDETHCEDWPCDNVYTRCDGIWHCSNGIDEANCKDSPCPPYTFPCLLSMNNTMICLPLSKMNDNITDCRGATDERVFCQQLYPEYLTTRYKCWNQSKCISTNLLCDKYTVEWYDPDASIDCDLYGDDEHFCPSYSTPDGVCDFTLVSNRTIEHKILCGLADKYARAGKRIFRNELHLSLAYAGYYPNDLHNKTESIININNNSLLELKQPNKLPLPKIDFKTAWFCYRGIYIIVSSKQYSMCLCPPSYYGPRCEYQNQRVSLTLQFRTVHLPSIWRMSVFHFFIMLIDEENTIDSHEQILYSPVRDCNAKFDVYLLYKTRSKNISRNYSVRIDAFIKNDLTYYASWHLPIPFLFLPVNRIASILTIPIRAQQPQHDCDENICGKHGRCIRYVSSANFFCQCDIDWKGYFCHIKRHNDDKCRCSSNSLCIEPGLCLCPLYQFGRRCYLTRSSCKSNTCSNQGLCISDDQRISESNFTCICNEGYWGKRCEYVSIQIDIYFINIPIPQAIHVHLIKAYENNLAAHERITTCKKIPVDQDFATLQISSLFNILFIEFDNLYYLTVLQEKFVLRNYISTEVNPSRRCSSIDKLLNSTQLILPILHRVKYYHRICRSHQNLPCFYDNIFMCLCNDERQSNCFSFDHKMKYDCQGRAYCQNDTQCYQDHPTCPTKLLCVCSECFYGSQCQFSTKDSSFSLDTILAYQIRPNVSFAHQRSIVKISLTMIIVIFCLGFINGIISTITFRIKQSQQVGCGIYLITASLISFLPIIMISLKFVFLFLTQTHSIMNRTQIFIGCILIDYILQITLNMGNWLNACVAIERSITICQGISFNKIKSRFIAKLIIFFLILLLPLTSLHEPFHRRLIDDDDQFDRRTLCIAIYSPSMKQFDLTMNIFHFIAPFVLNIISACIIIIIAARKRSTAQKQIALKQHLKTQLNEHKHLLISPIILIILSLPRLVLSLILGCMKSVRDPWLFLVGYFTSFFPTISIFITFVLPSDVYRKNFFQAIHPILLNK